MARKVLKGARLLDGRQPKGGGSKRWWVPAKAEKRAKAVVAAARAAGALPGAAQPAAARAPDPAAAHAGQVQQPVDAAAGPAAQGPAAAAAAVAAPAAAAAHPVETLIQEKGPQVTPACCLVWCGWVQLHSPLLQPHGCLPCGLMVRHAAACGRGRCISDVDGCSPLLCPCFCAVLSHHPCARVQADGGQRGAEPEQLTAQPRSYHTQVAASLA